MQARRLKLISATAILAALVFAETGPAHACACCSNTAQRYVETKPIDDFAAGILADIEFAPAAHLYTGEGDVETLGGIATKSTDFSCGQQGGGLVGINFQDSAGGGGSTSPCRRPSPASRSIP